MLVLHTAASQKDVGGSGDILNVVINLSMVAIAPASELIMKGNSHTTGSYQCARHYQLSGSEPVFRAACNTGKAIPGDNLPGRHAYSNKQAEE